MFPQYVFRDVSGREPTVLKYFILIHGSPNVILVFQITECGTLKIYLFFPYFSNSLSEVFVLLLRQLLQLLFFAFIYSHGAEIVDFYFGNILTLGLPLSISKRKGITVFVLLPKAQIWGLFAAWTVVKSNQKQVFSSPFSFFDVNKSVPCWFSACRLLSFY